MTTFQKWMLLIGFLIFVFDMGNLITSNAEYQFLKSHSLGGTCIQYNTITVDGANVTINGQRIEGNSITSTSTVTCQ